MPKSRRRLPEFSQAKTLFLPAPGTAGILVEMIQGRRTSKPMQFPGAHAALDWCLAQGVAFVYWQPPNPAKN
jgi:hypothetical protein